MRKKNCPDCEAEMENRQASGVDHKGRLVGVSWWKCPDCETIIDDFGEVIRPDTENSRKA